MEIIEHSENNNFNNKNKSSKTLLFIVIIIVAFFLGAKAMYFYVSKNGVNTTITKKTISQTKVTEEAIEGAIEKVYDSVLCIEVLDQNGDAQSTGTGFVYEKDNKYGYVLTNAHVVSGGSNIQATLSNEKVVSLKLLGFDSYTDLAVLSMDIKDVISVASIGSSSNIKVGNTVFTVGSPMGSTYIGTVTKGILSGKDRLIETSSSLNTNDSYIVKVLQTDAAISPGNSGGPLVDLAGDVIGINSLKLVNTEVEGMGFAIPIEDAMNYVDTLKKGDSIKRPVFGVQIIDLTDKYLLYRYNININSNVNEGVYIVDVSNDYPAVSAGIKKGDIITKVNGEKVTTTAEFKYELYKYSVGDEIEITYFRNGKENKVKVKLDKAN